MKPHKDFLINDLKVLIPDTKNTFDLYLNVKNKKVDFIDRYKNQTELWNLRVLKSQIIEINDYLDKLINSYKK